MIRLVLSVAVEDFWGNHLGDKEAVALALEPLGGQVRVLRVETQGLEQIKMGGVADEKGSIATVR